MALKVAAMNQTRERFSNSGAAGSLRSLTSARIAKQLDEDHGRGRDRKELLAARLIINEGNSACTRHFTAATGAAFIC